MSKKRRMEDAYYLRTYGVAGTGGQNRPRTGASTDPGEGTQLPGGPAGVPAGLEMVESTECVVGYRTWQLSEFYPEGYLLVSNADTVWTPFQRMKATCKPMDDYGSFAWGTTMSKFVVEPRSHPDHPSPDPTGSCFCGINAWKNRVSFGRSDNPNVVQVIGSLNLWGSVIEYPNGYRGQYAYPKELAVVGCGEKGKLEKIATKLELAYGVSCQVWE